MIDRHRVKIGINAPSGITVLRKEVTESESAAMSYMEAYNRRKHQDQNRLVQQNSGLLILMRKIGQSILIGPKVCVTVLEIDKYHRVNLATQAPDEVIIQREEKENQSKDKPSN